MSLLPKDRVDNPKLRTHIFYSAVLSVSYWYPGDPYREGKLSAHRTQYFVSSIVVRVHSSHWFE
jgi:hypothetical protein